VRSLREEVIPSLQHAIPTMDGANDVRAVSAVGTPAHHLDAAQAHDVVSDGDDGNRRPPPS